MGSFAGKVALITGGSSGIGRAAAEAFAEAGARVVLAARGAEKGEGAARGIRERGGEAAFVRADVSKARDVERLVAGTVERYGRLDVAFNNAGTEEGAFSLTADFTEEEFDRAVGINLKGVWLCMKHEIRRMLAQRPRGGAIVNTSSVSGLGGTVQGSLYAASKSGVIALTKSAASEYAREGIRVNALVAGAIRTPMLDRVFDRASSLVPGGREAVAARYGEMIAMGRIGSPEEAARIVLWLCSEEASYVTGHALIVDGGLSAAPR